MDTVNMPAVAKVKWWRSLPRTIIWGSCAIVLAIVLLVYIIFVRGSLYSRCSQAKSILMVHQSDYGEHTWAYEFHGTEAQAYLSMLLNKTKYSSGATVAVLDDLNVYVLDKNDNGVAHIFVHRGWSKEGEGIALLWLSAVSHGGTRVPLSVYREIEKKCAHLGREYREGLE